MIETLINYTKLDEDTIIDLLPFTLIEVRNYTNQYFLTLDSLVVSKIEDNKIYINGDISKFAEKQFIEIMNSQNNQLIYIIKEITDEYIEVYQNLENDNSSCMVVIKLAFGVVNPKVIAGMLNYDNEFGVSTGIKSQSLSGGYSVTYAMPDGSEGIYPTEMYGGIKSLKKLNDDYAEYRRKGYVRIR